MFNLDFSAFSQSVRIRTSSKEHLEIIEKSLEAVFTGHFVRRLDFGLSCTFQVTKNRSGLLQLTKDDEFIVEGEMNQKFFDFVESRVRIQVAENAPNHTFIHAGAVKLKDKAIIFPGKSYTGKSTLVLEMVKKGAQYLSDEYAVIDRDCRVVPFPKPISLRKPGEYEQTDHWIDEFGGVTSKESVEPADVVFSEYASENDWRIEKISKSEGVMRTLEHSVAARKSPQQTLETLGRLAERVSFHSVKRSEAVEAADLLTDLFTR